MKRVLVTGASGLIGTALQNTLKQHGSEIIRLVRSPDRVGKNAVLWLPGTENPIPDVHALEDCDAVVHLAGANLADHRWTPQYRQTIVDSRVAATRALLRALGQLRTPPRVLVAASATGIYGDRGDEVLTEASPAGTGYLPEVCTEWEAATGSAREL